MLAQVGAPAAALRAHEEMFAYWASRREGGRLPGRAHIHPEGFKRHLPTVSLIEVRRDADGARGYRVRLAGTGLYGVYGGETTGKALADIYAPAAADYWRGELDKVVEGRRPAVGMHSLAWRGAQHLSILWLRLPLAGDGREVDMILGYDAPVGGSASGAFQRHSRGLTCPRAGRLRPRLTSETQVRVAGENRKVILSSGRQVTVVRVGDA